jgi:hypothetical protein
MFLNEAGLSDETFLWRYVFFVCLVDAFVYSLAGVFFMVSAGEEQKR